MALCRESIITIIKQHRGIWSDVHRPYLHISNKGDIVGYSEDGVSLNSDSVCSLSEWTQIIQDENLYYNITKKEMLDWLAMNYAKDYWPTSNLGLYIPAINWCFDDTFLIFKSTDSEELIDRLLHIGLEVTHGS